jgi:phage-related protein
MADQSYSDYVQMYANAQVPMKKHTKGVQLLAIKYKLLSKTFGPFMDLWLKMKQGVQTFGEALEYMVNPTEEATEVIDGLNTAVELTGGYFKSLVMTMVLIVGIIMAVVGAVYLMAGSWSGMDSIIPGLTDGIDSVRASIENIFNRLQEAGVLDTIIGTLTGLFDTIMWSFGFILTSLSDVGITGGSVLEGLATGINTVVNFLFDAGIIDMIMEIWQLGAEMAGAIIKISAVIIGLLIRYLDSFWSKTSGFWKALAGLLGIVITYVVAVIRTWVAVFRAFVALLTGDFDGFKEHLSGIVDVWDKAISKMKSLFEGMIDNIMDFLQPFIDKIERVAEIAGDITGGIRSGASKAWDAIGFADGGISTGPNSGYMTQLHGTEAVVPLPNGRSIPVEISGAMGGGGGSENITVNINVSGGGNADEIARKVSQEVSRTFRNRSRSSGFGRGI